MYSQQVLCVSCYLNSVQAASPDTAPCQLWDHLKQNKHLCSMVWYMLPLESQAPPINHAAYAGRSFKNQRTFLGLMGWWRGGQRLNIKGKWAALPTHWAVAATPCLASPARWALSCLYAAKSQALMSKALGSGLQDVLVLWGSAQSCAHVFN